MKRRIIVLVSGLLLSSMAPEGVTAKVPAAEKQRLIDGWEFVRGDLGGVWETIRPVREGQPEGFPLWTEVALPHCFNATDAVDPEMNYYQGPGWYRTNLTIENPYRNGRTVLEFEGAGQKTEVWLFTEKIGEHTGGYDSWCVDITDAAAAFSESGEAARFDGKIPLSIRCDNTRDLETIPSDLSDFNLYGGLYRYVNLVYLPEVSVSAIRIEPRIDAKRKKGFLKISAGFNRSPMPPETTVTVAVRDPDGNTVLRKTTTYNDLSGMPELLDTVIDNPRLWDVDAPQLYTCEINVEIDGQTAVFVERFGFRHFEFVEKGPFQFNGRRLLLRGTHRHEDHAGVGAAMTEKQMRGEMELMKAMGVNFIRLGHYQQSEIILDLCDELGILVWEEIPWCRGGLGGDSYREMGKRMLRNMIEQHRNHPSVIIWGLGNENDWPGDFPEFDQQAIRDYMTELNDLSHALDPTRKTAIRRCAFCADIVDVYSPSIWAGWYRGIYQDYKAESEKEMQKVNHFLHVEWGGDSHAGRHAEDPYGILKEVRSGCGADERLGDAAMTGGVPRVSKDGDWSETYIVKLIDWHLREQETMPWLTGTAYWPFKDFSTPIRPENPIPYVNQKGVVERDLTPKESYYVFQSYWTDKPMIHIYGHSRPVRWGEPGEKKEILVYSNQQAVELFVNGVSAGIRRRDSQDFPAAGLRWNVPLNEGMNSVKAVSVPDRKHPAVVVDEIAFEYQTAKWGHETRIVTRVTHLPDGKARIDAQLVDEHGVRCLDSRNYFYFAVVGDGRLIEDMGTAGASSKVQARNGRASIVVADMMGSVVVSVGSDGLNTVLVPVEPKKNIN